MGKQYKTSSGRMVDVDSIRIQQEQSIAVGNMKVNAKGDVIGKNGEVIETAHERTVAYHKTATKVVTKTSVKPPLDTTDKLEDIDHKPVQKKKPSKKRNEVTLPDGSIEILDPENDEGNSL